MRRLLILSLLTLMSLGCRTDPSAQREIALLRAEILDLEDQYYNAQAQLQTCKGGSGQVNDEYYVPQYGNVQIIEGEYVEGYRDGGSANDRNFNLNCESCPPADNRIERGQTIETRSARPGDTLQNPNTRGNRVIPEIPSDTRGLEEISPDDSSYNRSDNSNNRIEIEFDDSYDFSSSSNHSIGDQLGRVETNSSDDVITRVSINKIVSGGQDLDGLPGHEGLVLLIQPQTQFGDVVQAPGELTISIIDIGERQSRRPVGLWRFTTDETKNFFVKQEYSEQGILLHLPWAKVTPRNRKLEVFVRYTTRDNRQLEASAEIEIEPPADDYTPRDALVAQWIERDERWVDNARTPQLEEANEREANGRFSQVNPEFRPTNVKSGRRISPPRWRPVR